MPSVNEKQRRFMWLVHGVQKGKISPGRVDGEVTKAANSMNQSDVEDFLMQECGIAECGSEIKARLLNQLREIQEPTSLEEVDDEKADNVIASTKDYVGDFETTIRKNYGGVPLQPKELQAATNFDLGKATVSQDRKTLEIHREDDFGNNREIIIRKLQDRGHLVFVAFVKSRNSEKPEVAGQPAAAEPGSPPEENPAADQIKLIKSTPIDDAEGSEILTNFMTQVWHKV